jgi:lipin, N-terminal conserved region
MNVLQGLTGILGLSGKSSQTHGALDVIVVSKTTQQSASESSVLDSVEQQKTVETLASTPWHVRFASSANAAAAGDNKRRPIVTLRVNGIETQVRMKVGDAGEAYFLRDVVQGEAARLGSELFSDTNDEESDWSDTSSSSSSNDADVDIAVHNDADRQQQLTAADAKALPAADVATTDAADGVNGHESDDDSKDENVAAAATNTQAASWHWRYGHLPHQRRKRSQPRPLMIGASHNQVSANLMYSVSRCLPSCTSETDAPVSIVFALFIGNNNTGYCCW